MNLDFAETFLDIAGAAVPSDMQGRSLVPLMKGEPAVDWPARVYYHYYEYPGYHSVHRHYGVRTERYKLIRFYELNEWELYDLAADPHELKSIYHDPQYAEIVKDLKRKLAETKAQYRDRSASDDFEVP